MKGKCLQNLVLLLLNGIILCSACGCSGRQKQVVTIGQDTIAHKRLKPMNSIYYWRTIFNPSEKELTFLKRQNVGRMYLRMFDVVDEWEERTVPNATIKFKRQVPKNIEVVPVVFIVKDIFENSVKDSLKVEKLAAQIVERVTRMCSWNGITNWSGLQLGL